MKNAEEFRQWKMQRASELLLNESYAKSSLLWLNEAVSSDYPYMFEWLGVPVIQFPADLILIQEALVVAKANKIIEIGIARGGTTLFLASILKLTNSTGKKGVIGVDIKVSDHTQKAIESSNLASDIKLIEGNSTSQTTFEEMRKLVEPQDRVMVILDSNHTEEHVLAEMELYSDIVSRNSFLIVMDTAIEYLSEQTDLHHRPWGKGNNPQTAIQKFLERRPGILEVDAVLNSRSWPGASTGGFLRKII